MQFDARAVIKRDFKIEKFLIVKAKKIEKERQLQRKNVRTLYLMQKN
jgi:hypothetical protein